MDSQSCEISVVMAAYNTGSLVRGTVESVLRALDGRDFELVIVNDGSTDKTGRNLRRLARDNPRIRLFEQSNSGAGPAKNAALAQARGRYVWLVDSDDLIPADAFANFDFGLFEQGPDIIICDYQLQRNQGRVEPLPEFDAKIYADCPRGAFTLKQHPGLLCSSHILCNRFHRRDFLTENKITLSQTVAHDDIFFHVKSLCLAKNIVRRPGVIYTYRLQHSYLSRLSASRMDALQGFADCEDFLRDNPKYAPAVSGAWRAFKANHLHFVYHYCLEQDRQSVRDYFDAFLTSIPKEEMLDFIGSPHLRQDVRDHALALRGLPGKLAEKMFSPSAGPSLWKRLGTFFTKHN